MKTLAIFNVGVAVSLLISGCATQSARPQPAGTAYTGEVWTWDERESTVTLRRGAEDIRVKVTPDQIRGLELHQRATVRGELAPPMEIASVVTPAMPVRAVPRGPADQETLNGVVTAADPRGRLSIESERGPLHVWAASGADQRFQPGAKVRVEMAVQPVDLIPAGAGAPSDPAASPPMPSQPGDHAVVTGRVMGIAKNGTLVIESPTGPVQVWVADSSKYRVEQPVQLRTSVATLP